MTIERREPSPQPPIYELDLSEGWDTHSQAELLLNKLKELGIYKKNLLFSGFDAGDIGKGSDIIFCSEEGALFSGTGGEEENALVYANDYESGVIAVYDGDKMELAPEVGGMNCYRMKEPSAILAIIKLK